MRTELAVLAALTGMALLTMVIYLLSPQGRHAGDTTGRGGSFFMGFWVRNWFYWFITPITRVSLALGLSPFFYNVAALACGGASLWFFADGRLPAAGAVILASGFADVMDGQIARARNIANDQGAFLDSTLDRFSEFAAFVGLALFYDSGLPVVLIVIALGGSMLVSYTRARGESVGVLCKAGFMQRAERMILMGFGAIVDPALSSAMHKDPGFVVLLIIALIAGGTVATAVFRTVWIARRLQP